MAALGIIALCLGLIMFVIGNVLLGTLCCGAAILSFFMALMNYRERKDREEREREEEALNKDYTPEELAEMDADFRYRYERRRKRREEAQRREAERKERAEAKKREEEEAAARLAYKKRLGKHWPAIQLLNRPGDSEEDTYLTYLAGARHYVDANERCGFVAIALPEPNNEYNPDAVVVWTIDKKIGYIPDDEVDDFNEWTGRRPVPCLGTRAIVDGKINTTLIAIRPANPDFIRTEVERAVDYIKAHYGDGMLPPDFEVQCKYADGVTPIQTTPDGTALAE